LGGNDGLSGLKVVLGLIVALYYIVLGPLYAVYFMVLSGWGVYSWIIMGAFLSPAITTFYIVGKRRLQATVKALTATVTWEQMEEAKEQYIQEMLNKKNRDTTKKR
jgi:hypothetical protein